MISYATLHVWNCSYAHCLLNGPWCSTFSQEGKERQRKEHYCNTGHAGQRCQLYKRRWTVCTVLHSAVEWVLKCRDSSEQVPPLHHQIPVSLAIARLACPKSSPGRWNTQISSMAKCTRAMCDGLKCPFPSLPLQPALISRTLPAFHSRQGIWIGEDSWNDEVKGLAMV